MSTDVFIYFDRSLPCGLDEIEDELEHAFVGRGEIVGSGLGEGGCNIDLSVVDGLSTEEIRAIVRSALSRFSPSAPVAVVVGDERFEISY